MRKILFTILLVYAIISGFSGPAKGCSQECGPCQYKDQYGNCQPKQCDSDNCKICIDGSCTPYCNYPEYCLSCNGHGGCIVCGDRPCEICKNGLCVSDCDPADCRYCDEEYGGIRMDAVTEWYMTRRRRDAAKV
jgi:hypothetical protein